MDFTQHWHWPQWTLAILYLLGLLTAAVKHGQPKDPWNFPGTMVSTIILTGILVCGGFFP